MTERMRRMLEQTFGGFGWPSPPQQAGWSPLVDIEEADDAVAQTLAVVLSALLLGDAFPV